MVRTIKHRGLKKLFVDDDRSRLQSGLINRIEDILGHLGQATRPSDLNLPGFRLHQLKGDQKGIWSITVSGNWRIIFRFEDGDVWDVDLVDYH